MVKRIILGIVGIVAAVLLAYAIMYGYLYTRMVFTWQCQIYTGEMSPEGRQVCDDYNQGGLWRVVTH